MRDMISLIDKLRDFQLDNYISLPRIAVLGEQSAGKSSLLEAVCGLNFLPRGTGIVTRRPLELRMVRSKVTEPYFVFPKDFPDKKYTKYEDIVNTIETLTDKATNGTKSISDLPIVLTVYSPTVPDLTLVDLPGITRNAVEGQPANIEEISKNLVSKYCSDSNTLILCVIPANIDLSTSDALSFVRKLDPDGSRTLGVLTKIDIINEGDDCRDVLLNKVIPLKYGYIGVKGRTQLEIKNKVPVSEAIKRELEYFSKDPLYSVLPAEILGTRALIDKMSSILLNMIQNFLPQLKTEISSRIRSVKNQLEGLGEEFPEEEEKKLEMVFRLVRKFKENFDQAINGKFLHEKPNPKKEVRTRDSGDTITYQLSTQFLDLFQKYSVPEFRISSNITDEQIDRALETYQASSMPGFYSIDSFLSLINPKLETLKDPVISLLEECKTIIETKGLEQIDSVFKKFPKLHQEVRDAFIKFLVQEKSVTRKILENLVRSEENYLFTNDSSILTHVIQDKSALTAKDYQIREMRIRIDSYFSIVIRNLRDFVPKIIGQYLVKHFNSHLEVEILNALGKKNYCTDVLSESDVTVSLRSKLRAEFTSLQKADNLLVNAFHLGYSVNKKSLTEEKAPRKSRASAEHMMTYLEELNDIEALNDEYLKMNEELARRHTGKSSSDNHPPVPGSAGQRLSQQSHFPSQVGMKPIHVRGATPDKAPQTASNPKQFGKQPSINASDKQHPPINLNPTFSQTTNPHSTQHPPERKPVPTIKLEPSKKNDPFDYPDLVSSNSTPSSSQHQPTRSDPRLATQPTPATNNFNNIFQTQSNQGYNNPAQNKFASQIIPQGKQQPTKTPTKGNLGSLFGDAP